MSQHELEMAQRLAQLSVRRALGFAGLGMFSVMAGLAFDPPLALRSGALLCVIAAVVLGWMGWSALERPYQRTEMWILLDPSQRPTDERTRAAIGPMLRGVYYAHAEGAAAFGLALFVISLPVDWLLP